MTDGGLASDVTQLLQQATGGDVGALERAYKLLHNSLRGIVQRRMAHHEAVSLDATMVINDLWMKLSDQPDINWENRQHFFGLAARMVRQLLCDHARARGAVKRGARRHRVTMEEAPQLEARDASQTNLDLLELDEALQRLDASHPSLAEVVELRYFAGLGTQEVADLLGLNAGTVRRRWTKAKTLLHVYLTTDETSSGP